MSANSVLPPFDGTLRACSSEYFAGIALNELSECHRRLPMADSRRRASRADGGVVFSGVGAAAEGGGRRAPLGAPRLVALGCSVSPQLWGEGGRRASSGF